MARITFLKAIVITLFATTTTTVVAKNDWNTPCHNGECVYHGSTGGSVRIWGHPTAISDVTPAGGWEILDCDADTLDQDIRLVCVDEDTCKHLHSGKGAVGTLVRLPEVCGRGPFAHVAKIWDHENRQLPSRITQKLKQQRRGSGSRRRKTEPMIHGVSLSTDFNSTDTRHGQVFVSIQGSTHPHTPCSCHPTPKPSSASSNSTSTSESEIGDVTDHVAAAADVPSQQFIHNAFTAFNKNLSTSLPPISVHKNFPLVDLSVECPQSTNGQGVIIPGFSAAVHSEADIKVDAMLGIGLAAQGTIIPPKLDYVGVFSNLNADVEGTLKLTGSATGAFDIGTIDVYTLSIPGLDFPGILTLGPTFKIQAQAKADLDIGVDLTVGLTYKANNAKSFFPPNPNFPGGGGFGEFDTPLTLSVTPSVASKGTVEAHIIPVLDLGLSALGGLAKASVFLNLDASATLKMDLTAQAQAVDTTVISSKNSAKFASTTASRRATSISVQHSGQAEGNANGCVDIGAGLNVNLGANANFFGLFDVGKKVKLFGKDWDLVNKCFGDKAGQQAPKPRTVSTTSFTATSLTKRVDLGCPITGITQLSKLVTLS